MGILNEGEVWNVVYDGMQHKIKILKVIDDNVLLQEMDNSFVTKVSTDLWHKLSSIRFICKEDSPSTGSNQILLG